MQGADLRAALMQGARLGEAKMQGTDLEFTQMQGAELSRTDMNNNTNLKAAKLQGAAMRSVDYTDVPISPDQVKLTFRDASVTLPEGTQPPNWPKVTLQNEFPGVSPYHTEWRAFQKDPEGYDWQTRKHYYTELGYFSDLGPPPDAVSAVD